jgi:predicted house-cleaning noncanonical NTP pyrophosphatase (MazG superfamily)
MRYHKLVRDQVPAELRQQHLRPVVQVLTDDQYRLALNKRLQADASGHLKDKSLEELSDIVEIIYAIAALRGATPDQLEALRQRKAHQKGGYTQHYFLIETNE